MSETVTHSVDLVIVGAGPVGLYGAYYAGVRGLSTIVIDSLSQVGGQVTAMYPEKLIYDVAGFPAVKGRELVAGLERQAAHYEPSYLLGREVQACETHANGRHTVTTSAEDVIDCGAVIITGGIGTFTPRALPAGEDFLGRGLDYFVPDPNPYANADVVVVGGGDSALDWALMLEPLAKSVTLVHRRKAFRAHHGTVEQVIASSVEVITDAEVSRLVGDDGLHSAQITFKNGGDVRDLPCQQVVAALGFLANLGPLREWDLELHDNRHIVVDTAMRTNRAGIYAGGDIVDYEGKVRLIATGFGEVATAVNNAAVYINPDTQLFPGHSTDAQPATVPA